MSTCKECKFYGLAAALEEARDSSTCFLKPPKVWVFMGTKRNVAGQTEPAPINVAMRPGVRNDDLACRHFQPSVVN